MTFALLFSESRQAYATAACLDLTAEQSEDKNFYKFKATASAANNAQIIGYEFDFGDQQSYRFNFHNTPSQNRNTATVKHTYEKSNKYIATVNVISSAGDKETRASSPACTAQVTIGQTTAELPATGPGDTLVLQVIIVGLATYGVVLRATKSRVDFS
jgi:hypothetical protein